MPATATDRLAGITTSVAVKAPCAAVTAFDIPLTGLFTVNGVALQEGDRVLVRAQTNATQNGIYLASSSDWQRALDFDGARDVVCGTLALVRNSIAQGAIYQVTTPDPIVIGSSALHFDLRDDPAITYVQTAPEISAAVVPSNFTYPAGRPVIEVQRYGALLDGTTDDSLALKRACAVASIIGGLVHIPASANGLAVDSAQFPLAAYSNIAIVGDGMNASKIKVIGTVKGHLLDGLNIKGFRIADIGFIGNGQGDTVTQAAALNFIQDGTAAQIGGDICIERCFFTNFKAPYWLNFRNTGSTYAMENIWVRDCRFLTVNDNTIGLHTDIGPSSYILAVEGQSNYSGSGSIGLVRNVWVQRNYAECTYNKGFGVAWESTRNVYFEHNVVDNAGQNNSNDAANYAFLVYNNGGVSQSPDPDNIHIAHNTVSNPRDCGVYSAMHGIGSSRVFVYGNTITGQNSTATGTLPKGAIALNGPLVSVVEDNRIDSCYWGITVIGQYTPQTCSIRRNRVTNGIASGQSIYVQATLTGSMARAEIVDNYVNAPNATVRGIYADVTSAAGIANLLIERNIVSSAYECIEVSSRSGVALLGYVSISHNECNGQSATAAGIAASALSNAATRTRVVGNRFTGTWGNINLMNISSSLGLTVINNEWTDISNGACIASNGARGRLEGNRFVNVTAANVIFVSGGEDLGRSTPTWTGNCNDFIENLQPVEAGSAASKYVILGWRWDATAVAWKQNRCLTGN